MLKDFFSKKSRCVADLAKDFFAEYFDVSVGGSSAQLSYYFLFSLFPFLMSTSALAVFYSREAVFLSDLLPDVLDELFTQFLEHSRLQSNAAFFSSGLILFLYAMARYINCIKRKLRDIFVTEREHGIVTEWILSLVYSVFIFVGLVFTFALQSAGAEIIKYFSDKLFFIPAVFIFFWPILRFGFIGIYVFALLLLLYKTVPTGIQTGSSVIKAAFLASVSWILISVGFSFYIDNISNHSGVYGSISAFIVLMLWLYIVNNIILSGAVFAKILSQKR